MATSPGSIAAVELRDRFRSGGEIAIIDAREEGSFHNRHLLMASCLPLSRLELIAPALIPRRGAPIVVCDDGEGQAERAAARLIAARRCSPRAPVLYTISVSLVECPSTAPSNALAERNRLWPGSVIGSKRAIVSTISSRAWSA
jgi:rhodanese-related sulfurtransferase